jgi:hypothetical protein
MARGPATGRGIVGVVVSRCFFELDWRCPECHSFDNNAGSARTARAFAPRNGRATRPALREPAAERRTQAILRKRVAPRTSSSLVIMLADAVIV